MTIQWQHHRKILSESGNIMVKSCLEFYVLFLNGLFLILTLLLTLWEIHSFGLGSL